MIAVQNNDQSQTNQEKIEAMEQAENYFNEAVERGDSRHALRTAEKYFDAARAHLGSEFDLAGVCVYISTEALEHHGDRRRWLEIAYKFAARAVELFERSDTSRNTENACFAWATLARVLDAANRNCFLLKKESTIIDQRRETRQAWDNADTIATMVANTGSQLETLKFMMDYMSQMQGHGWE